MQRFLDELTFDVASLCSVERDWMCGLRGRIVSVVDPRGGGGGDGCGKKLSF